MAASYGRVVLVGKAFVLGRCAVGVGKASPRAEVETVVVAEAIRPADKRAGQLLVVVCADYLLTLGVGTEP